MIEITNKFDILETDGKLVMPAGYRGEIVEVKEPPHMMIFKAAFATTTGVVERWYQSSQLNWIDGLIGPLRAILAFRSAVVVDVMYKNRLSNRDLAIDGKLPVDPSILQFLTDDGYAITIESDANNAITTKFEFLG